MIPTVPKFATMRSVLSVWALAGELPGFLDDVSAAIGAKSDGEHDLGRAAVRLSRDVFREWYSPRELVEHHTHVPLFASLMSPLQALGWIDGLVSRTGGRDPIAAQLRRIQQIQAMTLRRCPTCVGGDKASYGCAHWRIFHQWPVARHCAVHGDRLETTCARCHAPIARLPVPQLADDRCRVCGGDAWISKPFLEVPAYWPMLTEMYEALRTGKSATPTPAARVAAAIRCSTVYRDGHGMLDKTERIFAAWRVGSLEQLAGVLGTRRGPAQSSGSACATDQYSSLMKLACDQGAKFDAAGRVLTASSGGAFGLPVADSKAA